MRTLVFLLEKEFLQIFRNKAILALILVMPTVQLLVLPLAADYEIKNINLTVVDNDQSMYSRRLLSNITASHYVKLMDYGTSFRTAMEHMEKDKADLILEIPRNFERDLIREGKNTLLISVNAINGVKANLGGSYLNTIIREFNTSVRMEWSGPVPMQAIPTLGITSSFWYNPDLEYHLFMVPGILAILVTMVGGFLTALNIVKEKETGTIEQINVTPIKKHYFILGKLIPFWILGNVVFTVGLGISALVYGIVPQGSLMLLYGFIWVYLLAVLGFGLWISTFCDNQQQAMFIMFFFMMVFILMGGLFTSIDAMPEWAQWISRLNPISYLIAVMRMVILKGSGFQDILPHLYPIAIIAVVLNGLAIFNYRKTT